jgi:hypothetical protein
MRPALLEMERVPSRSDDETQIQGKSPEMRKRG